jgi:acylphosphatase
MVIFLRPKIMRKHLKVNIYGQVQGVFFRQHTKEKAEEMGITGFVRNEPDGRVYVEAEGEEKQLKKFLVWCRQGPRWAEVKEVKYQYSYQVKNYREFVIKY